MPNFTEQDAENCVAEALSAVANFDRDNLRNYRFNHFHDYHKKKFLSGLKLAVNNHKTETQYMDIVLNFNHLNEWLTMEDCINYVHHYAVIVNDVTHKIDLGE